MISHPGSGGATFDGDQFAVENVVEGVDDAPGLVGALDRLPVHILGGLSDAPAGDTVKTAGFNTFAARIVGVRLSIQALVHAAIVDEALFANEVAGCVVAADRACALVGKAGGGVAVYTGLADLKDTSLVTGIVIEGEVAVFGLFGLQSARTQGDSPCVTVAVDFSAQVVGGAVGCGRGGRPLNDFVVVAIRVAVVGIPCLAGSDTPNPLGFGTRSIGLQ